MLLKKEELFSIITTIVFFSVLWFHPYNFPDKYNFVKAYFFDFVLSIGIVSILFILLFQSSYQRLTHFDYVIIFYIIYILIYKYISIDRSIIYSTYYLNGAITILIIRRLNLTSIKYFEFCVLLSFYGQLIYGYLQYFNILESSNSYSIVVGSFINSGPYTIFLVCCFIFLLSIDISNSRLKTIIILLNFALCIPIIGLTNSRTAILGLSVGLISYIYIHYKNYFYLFIGALKSKIFLIFIGILLLCTSVFIFISKYDSAVGRLLIWKISLYSTNDHLFTGKGIGFIESNFLKYQYLYFENNHNPNEIRLTDSINSLFNEYIEIFIEQGLVGFIILILAIFTFINTDYVFKINFERHKYLPCILCVLASSLTSYTIHIAPTYFLFIMCFVQINSKEKSYYTKLVFLPILYLEIVLLFNQYSFFLSYKYFWSGSNYLKADQFKSALIDYEKVKLKLNKDGFFLTNYGDALFKNGKVFEAIDVLEEASQITTSLNIYSILGDSYFKTGNIKLAEKNYKILALIVPSRVIPKYKLLIFYYKTKMNDKAISTAKEILKTPIKFNSSVSKEITTRCKLILIELNSTKKVV